MMPNLPTMTLERDRETIPRVWNTPEFMPDELKIYPMVITHHTQIEDLWRSGVWKPYSDKDTVSLMADLTESVPHFMRINRVYRDIPSQEIIAGCLLANLREASDAHLASSARSRKDISAREVRLRTIDPNDLMLRRTDYEASLGKEIFLEWVEKKTDILVALCRLRIPSWYF